MGLLSLTLPADGETIDASDVNGPFNAIASLLNGQLDDTNFLSISGSKISANTIPYTALTTAAVTALTKDWKDLAIPTSVVYNGQGSYTATFSTDQSSIVYPGTRLRTTRTVAAPTQSTLLNGTSQFWNNTSPTKLTFTDDFVVSAWVKLTSYINSYPLIMSRTNSTSGWEFGLNPNGQVYLQGNNAGSGNASTILSNQSLPLNKWVHVTAQLDMSAFSATPTTSYIMFDGVDIVSVVSRSGTNPTTLIQAGNLVVGSRNTGIDNFFPGKIAQAAVFGTKQTQAAMRGYMSQGLVGTETSLLVAYAFNGSGNDLVATPHNLTAQGGAVATNADGPFGGQGDGTISATVDYAVVMVTTPTTITWQTPEGSKTPTSGGITSIAYSGLDVPYNFPVAFGKWQIITLYNMALIQSSPTTNTTYNIAGAQLLVPVGSYNLKYKGSLFHDGANTPGASHLSFAQAGPIPISTKLSSASYIGNTGLITLHTGEDTVTVAAAAPVYVNSVFNGNGTTMQWYTTNISGRTYGGLCITADNAYV